MLKRKTLEIALLYGVEVNQMLFRKAEESLSELKQFNVNVPTMRIEDEMLKTGRVFNIKDLT